MTSIAQRMRTRVARMVRVRGPCSCTWPRFHGGCSGPRATACCVSAGHHLAGAQADSTVYRDPHTLCRYRALHSKRGGRYLGIHKVIAPVVLEKRADGGRALASECTSTLSVLGISQQMRSAKVSRVLPSSDRQSAARSTYATSVPGIV
eukprot:3941930-Rhodomonas_salina.26